jgi:hypothetical protein
MLKFYT